MGNHRIITANGVVAASVSAPPWPHLGGGALALLGEPSIEPGGGGRSGGRFYEESELALPKPNLSQVEEVPTQQIASDRSSTEAHRQFEASELVVAKFDAVPPCFKESPKCRLVPDHFSVHQVQADAIEKGSIEQRVSCSGVQVSIYVQEIFPIWSPDPHLQNREAAVGERRVRERVRIGDGRQALEPNAGDGL